MDKTKKTLNKGEICRQLEQENRPYSLEVLECIYQVTKEKFDKIPMPINSYLRKMCKDPHYDWLNSLGIPFTHITLSFECKAGSPTSTTSTNGPNRAQKEVLKTIHSIAMEFFKKLMQSTSHRLGTKLHNYLQHSGLSRTPNTSPSERSITPPPPTVKDRSTWMDKTWATQQKPLFTTKRTQTPRSITGPSLSTNQGKRRHDSPQRHRQEKHSLYWRCENH